VAEDRSSLHGRVAIVTGASGGIGGAIAVRLAAAGADLAPYSGHRQEAEVIGGRVRAMRRSAVVLHADLAEPRMSSEIVTRTRDELGPADILVANAGVGRKLAWDDEALDLEAWDEAMAVNLRAPWLLTQAVLPDMLERNFGRLLYVSSVAALNGGVVGPHYAASKDAM
jgi:3-oxoacyl-[acyl-carrier protein] reductase